MRSVEREELEGSLRRVGERPDPRPSPQPIRPAQMPLFPEIADRRPDPDQLRRIVYL